MPDFEDKFTSWEPPDGDPRPPLSPRDKFTIVGTSLTAVVAEGGNWALHATNYALINPVGSDIFISETLGLPAIPVLADITLGMLINGTLGLAAVGTPVFLFSQILDKHEEIFSNPREFFGNGLNKLVTAMLGVLYFVVIVTEFMALSLRVSAESGPSPIPDMAAEPTGYWPMLLMSLALILVNAAMGFATAYFLRSARRTLKGG